MGDSSSYPGIQAIYVTHIVCIEILPGSTALSHFTDCGLPRCEAFVTEEAKLEGTLCLSWEWVKIEDAELNCTKGLSVPSRLSISSCESSGIPKRRSLGG